MFDDFDNNEWLSDSISNNFYLEDFNTQKQYYNNVKRLNDYDYNILQQEAYKDIKDELFKLEYKISNIQSNIRDTELQIQAYRDIGDYDNVTYYIEKKNQLLLDLDKLIDIYNEKSLSSKISGEIFNVFSPKIKNFFSRFCHSIEEFKNNIISRLPHRVSSVLQLKQSLLKLENISRNVDELMSLQTPYGEADDKYLQLSKYITRANNIQAQISRTLK